MKTKHITIAISVIAIALVLWTIWGNVAILHDEFVEITQNNEAIQIAGLDDPDFTDTDSFVQESLLEMKPQ